MGKTYINGYKPGICTHPEGPDSGVFAPECCCPDKLTTHGDTVFVDCRPECVHHTNHNKEK